VVVLCTPDSPGTAKTPRAKSMVGLVAGLALGFTNVRVLGFAAAPMGCTKYRRVGGMASERPSPAAARGRR
jgi:hypothetical protein